MISILFAILLFASCAGGKDLSYAGSTPAGNEVRIFLGISSTDSIDFIRWKLTLRDKRYQLVCYYGIGKPNTNGFINGGNKLELQGEFRNQNGFYRFYNDRKTLDAVELNTDLLHLLDSNNHLMVGNAGWSYTLNNTSPAGSELMIGLPSQAFTTDSIVFEGRTPCNIPGLEKTGRDCMKLKWYLVMYKDRPENTSGTYRLINTLWRQQGGVTGRWKMVPGINGKMILQLNDAEGNAFVYLIQLDNKVLMFADQRGRLLVGNENFSYTLNESR